MVFKVVPDEGLNNFFFKVYKRAIKIANAFVDLMGKEPLNNCPILEDKETEPEVKGF